MALPVVTQAYFTGLFAMNPQLVNTPAAVIEALGPVAQIYVSESVFPPINNGAVQLYAQALVMAHFITLDQLNGGGSLTTDKVGELSTSQVGLDATGSNFKMTSYGMRYLALGRTFNIPTMFVGGGRIGPIPPFSFPQQTWSR
jgi:hypothetical protein